jgi:hypothetical protein
MFAAECAVSSRLAEWQQPTRSAVLDDLIACLIISQLED